MFNVALTAVWFALALLTLLMLMMGGDLLAGVLTAWFGGVLSVLLYTRWRDGRADTVGK